MMPLPPLPGVGCTIDLHYVSPGEPAPFVLMLTTAVINSLIVKLKTAVGRKREEGRGPAQE